MINRQTRFQGTRQRHIYRSQSQGRVVNDNFFHQYITKYSQYTALFLVLIYAVGYVRLRIYYKIFNLNISDYLSFEDLLIPSFSTLAIVGGSFLVLRLEIFILNYIRSRRPRQQQRSRILKIVVLVLFFLSLIALMTLVWFLIQSSHEEIHDYFAYMSYREKIYHLISYNLILVIALALILLKKVFSSNLLVDIFVLLSTLGLLVQSAQSEGLNVLEKRENNLSYFSTESFVVKSQPNYFLIGSLKGFIVFFDYNDQSCDIYPQSEALQIHLEERVK